MEGNQTFRLALWSFFGLALTAIGLWWLVSAEMDLAQMLRDARQTPSLFWTTALIYTLCLAVPYMPGLELGILMMMVFGRPGVVAAYVGTLVGLNLAFLAGRWIRSRFSHTRRFELLTKRVESWDQDSQQTVNKHSWAGRIFDAFRHRGDIKDYLLVGLLLNLPGNWLLGGGGGISLASGVSGRMQWHWFVLTTMLATCLVPFLAFFGIVELERWFALAL